MRLINQRVARPVGVLLAALPFVVVIIVYIVASHHRLADNPADKLLPALETMMESFWKMAAVPDRRSGEYLLWKDTMHLDALMTMPYFLGLRSVMVLSSVVTLRMSW